jgi:hypothetical protein
MWVCETCGVEHAEAVAVCAICSDERQWVPADGQKWATLEQLTQAGRRVQIIELEPDLFGITVEPKVGIGQQTHLVRTPDGNLLWDPVGYLDDEAVNRVRELGEVTAIAASHPHMFGVQVEWSKALGGAPVLVSEADVDWIRARTRRSRPGAGGTRSRRVSRCTRSGAISPEARLSTGRPAPAARACCSSRTRSTPILIGRR